MAAKKWSGASQLKRDIRAFERKTTGELRRTIDQTSHILASSIISSSPVDTGMTRDSVQVRPARRQKYRLVQIVSVGSGRGSGHDVGAIEYGHENMQANPFFRAAIEATQNVRESMIRSAAK